MFNYAMLQVLHKQITSDALVLLNKKNSAYSKDPNKDALSNLKMVQALGCCTTQQGIITRMCDKLSRLSNLTRWYDYTDKQEKIATDESVRDTIIDLINYAILLEASRVEKNEKENNDPENDGDWTELPRDKASWIEDDQEIRTDVNGKWYVKSRGVRVPEPNPYEQKNSGVATNNTGGFFDLHPHPWPKPGPTDTML